MIIAGCTRRGRKLVTSCALVLVGACAIAGTGGPSGSQLAVWEPHTVLVRLRTLPKPYSCNELRRKFRDVLLRLGARVDVDIRPYRCERALGPAARSPDVRLTFYAPRAVRTRPAPGAQLRAASRTIRIAPGEPASIDASDCELLRQMKAALPGDVIAFRLACRAPQIATPPFSVSIRTLMPLPAGAAGTEGERAGS